MIPDNPIGGASQDLLNRAPLAALLAQEMRTVDAAEGCVIGIFGPWGSGKTSLINLIRAEVAREPALDVFDFNPWMFSGSDQLLDAFFREIGAQFRTRSDRLAAMAAAIDSYAEVIVPLRFVPVVGPWIERLTALTGSISRWHDRRRGGAAAQRVRLAASLALLERPIVIVVDDIDRLHTSEIREIFKLVRLVANFPNVIYLLAFDRQRVESALSEEGLPGRDYLEKIIQIPYDIPAIPEQVVTLTLTQAINESLGQIDNSGPFDEKAWPDVLLEIIKPVIRSLRDVRRYVASVQGTVRALDGKVALVDVLGLEAVRIFTPDVFTQIQKAQRALTSTDSPMGIRGQDTNAKASIDALISAAGDNREVATATIRRLFPAALRYIENNNYGSDWQAKWLRERRVAHVDVLRYYLERVASPQLSAFDLAERAFVLFDNGPYLETFFAGLAGTQLADTIAALEVFQEEFPPESVPIVAPVLLNQTARIPFRHSGLFGLRPDMIVGRVILRLFRRLDSAEKVEQAVPVILRATKHMSDQFDLLKLVGNRPHVGQKLISAEAESRFLADLRLRVAGASAEELASEHALLLLLYWMNRPEEGQHELIVVPDDPRVYAQLLREALTESRSQTLGSRAVSRRSGLQWEILIEVVGGEDRLRAMLPVVEALGLDDPELKEAIQLTQRHLTGWRPSTD